MTSYRKPPGYRRSIAASTYRPNNGYVNGYMQSGAGPQSASAYKLTMTFGAAPANGSSITAVPDGPPNNKGTPSKTFTFTWAGSPGAGIIPLVAGGGTAAQAATAAQVAMSAQLNNWTVTNPSAGVLVLTNKNPGLVATGTGLSGSTGITSVDSPVVIGEVLPGRSGQIGCTLAGS